MPASGERGRDKTDGKKQSKCKDHETQLNGRMDERGVRDDRRMG